MMKKYQIFEIFENDEQECTTLHDSEFPLFLHLEDAEKALEDESVVENVSQDVICERLTILPVYSESFAGYEAERSSAD